MNNTLYNQKAIQKNEIIGLLNQQKKFDNWLFKKRPAAFRTFKSGKNKSVRSCKLTANNWEHEI